MRAKEQIEAVLQQYKSILESYRGVFSRTAIEAGHNEDAPEYGFDRKQMAKPDSNLFAMIGREFIGKPLEQAQQQIDFWRVMYIDVQETNNPFSFEGTPEHQQWKALGQTFLDNARAMAERWCNRGEATPRGAGYLPPDKGTAEKGTDTNLEPTRGKGRPKETLQDKVIGGDTGLIKKLHSLIDGKKGKDLCLYIVACIKLGKLTKPTYTQVKKEFGDIGNKAGYNRYMDEQKFTNIELEGAMNQIKAL